MTIGLENVSKYPYLIAELVDREYTPEQITKVIGGNIFRAFQQVEDVANALVHETPRENTIYPDDLILEDICRTNN